MRAKPVGVVRGTWYVVSLIELGLVLTQSKLNDKSGQKFF